MRIVKFKDLPEKVREFLLREYFGFAGDYDEIGLIWLHAKAGWSKAKDEERLAYAEWKYPKGTKFKPAHVPNSSHVCEASGKFTIMSENFIYDPSCFYNNLLIHHFWYEGKWAEIIEEEEEPTFKAGDEVEYQGSTISKVIHVFDGITWIKNADQKYGSLVDLSNLRKPDPDKVYREIADDILSRKSYEFATIKEFSLKRNELLNLLIEALKKGKDL